MKPPDFSRRIPQLDGLRGIAIAMVVAHHYVAYAIGAGATGFTTILGHVTNFGWSGVDLFFVLSGFLIGGILIDARELSNFFTVFYRRRFYRIFPLYFAFLGVLFLAASATEKSLPGLFEPAIPWPAALTFCQNFWMAIHSTMGAVALGPTWSLAIEEQFYLTLPLLIYVVKPSRLMKVVAAGVVFAPLARLAIFLTDHRLWPAVYVLLPCRMDSLLIGVGVAYFLRRPGAWEFLLAHRRHIWTLVEALTVVCAFVLFRASNDDWFTMFLVFDCLALLFACLLVTSLIDDSLAEILTAKWLTGLGTIAYGVYLTHPLMFGLTYLMLKGCPLRGQAAAFIGLGLTIGLAATSWRWIERPLMRMGHREGYHRSKPNTGHFGNIEDLHCFPAEN